MVMVSKPMVTKQAPPMAQDPSRWGSRAEQVAMLDSDSPRAHGQPDPEAPPPELREWGDTPYIELHLHSCFSFLDGASSIDELAERAAELGYPALALTDHDGLHGALEFAQALKERGIRPITGAELTISDGQEGPRSHVTVLAETREGYRNLCQLLSSARGLFLSDAKAKDQRRREPWLHAADLRARAAGLILLIGGRRSELADLAAASELAAAERELRGWLDAFGPDQVFVELQDHLVYGDAERNRRLAALAERVGVGVVGAGNVHYHERARHKLHDVLTAVQHRKTLEQSHRERRANDEFFLRSPTEQAERYAAYHPQAAANSVRIARRCQFDITADLGYRLPSPELAGGQTPIERLEQLCRERLIERYSRPGDQELANARLQEELRLIEHHDLAGFFLIYHEVFELAKQVAHEIRGEQTARGRANLPVGRGRGSSVASIVCYLIGLSHIDPIANKLYLGRFLNEELHSLPDIDLDFPRDIRARLIERVYEHWGRDHAALVATFPTYRLRSAVRDIGKALGLPQAELGRLSQLAGPYSSASELHQEVQRYPEFASRVDAPGWRELMQLAPQLAGLPRHISEHVGGIVIASDQLIDCVPCQPAAWEGRYLCQWDKDSVDDARMVKIDFLALGMLSAVEDSISLIAEQHGRVVDLSRINFADQALYEDICRGDTVGVFQIESRAQIAMLPRTQPRNIEDLAVQVAIVRPGPIVGGAVNPYVRERERQRTIPNYRPRIPHECVREALSDTLGVVLFQEQVLQVAQAMGGFSPGKADRFRRAMSRKNATALVERYRASFMQGAAERGVAVEVAERVFHNLIGFAEFGFPHSHSVAFALLAYQTSWLKRYFAVEFYCGLFNSQPMGFYPPHVLTNDAQRHRVGIRRPAINRSEAHCSVLRGEGDQLGAVGIGLAYVQAVGAAGAETIEQARRQGGDFRSMFDFVQRTGLSRQATENLIRVGAFDEFGLNRRELIWQLGLFHDGMARGRLRGAQQRQLRLPLPTAQDQVSLQEFSPVERMTADYELLSLSPDAHPMQFFRPALGEGVASSRHLQHLPQGELVSFAGLVVCRQRPQTARGIVFLLLEDEFGLVNVLISKELDAAHPAIVRTASYVVVEGRLERRAGQFRTLIANKVQSFSPTTPTRMPEGHSWA